MICASVQEKSFGDCRAILESCEMAELRADLCRLSVEEVERLVEIRPNLIATCRIANSSEAFAREQLEAAIRRGARYVDIEIEAPDEHLEYIRTLAREYGCRLIVSFHDFEGTPSLDELKGIARLCRTKGADLVKIVTTARNISDAAVRCVCMTCKPTERFSRVPPLRSVRSWSLFRWAKPGNSPVCSA